MKYNNIDALDKRIENIIHTKVKHYYTDWKNYDRPKYMKLKGSKRRQDKTIILIARECGTYLFTLEDIENREASATIYEYFYTQSSTSDYYFIDLAALKIEKINPALFLKASQKAA